MVVYDYCWLLKRLRIFEVFIGEIGGPYCLSGGLLTTIGGTLLCSGVIS